jgi:hypothetical protein
VQIDGSYVCAEEHDARIETLGELRRFAKDNEAKYAGNNKST